MLENYIPGHVVSIRSLYTPELTALQFEYVFSGTLQFGGEGVEVDLKAVGSEQAIEELHKRLVKYGWLRDGGTTVSAPTQPVSVEDTGLAER